MKPIYLFRFTLLLAAACLVTLLCSAGQLLAGTASWEELSCELIFAQLGVFFFGLFSVAAWKQYKGDTAQVAAAWLVWLFMLELTGLLGWGACICYRESREFVDAGIEVQGRIVGHEAGANSTGKRGVHAGRAMRFLVYEYKTSDGTVHQGKQQAGGAFCLLKSRYEIAAEDAIGASVPVLYLESAPAQSTLNRFGSLWFLPLCLGGVTVLFAGISVWMFARLIKGVRGGFRRRNGYRNSFN